MNSQSAQLKKAIKHLYSSVRKLQLAFKGRLFTPDGRMVGDIGEAIASLEFGVEIDRKSKQHWDGYRIGPGGKHRMVQIKTTQKDETYLKEPPQDGDLLVFKISDKGQWKCCYDGPIMRVWKKAKKTRKQDKTGSIMIPLSQLCDKASCNKCLEC